MSSTPQFFARAAFYFAFGSAVSALFSIAVCHTLLALALAALLISGEKMDLPPLRLPLALFVVGTVISLALSDDPSLGRPQIRKFYVFLILLVVYSTFRRLSDIRLLVLSWTGVGALSALFGLAQFQEKLSRARSLGRNFYEYYVPERITGFMSHWMTFGGELMIVLLLLAAFLFFSGSARRRMPLWLGCGALVLAALILGYTRSIWLATFTGGVYLMWFWKRWSVALVPLLLAAGLWLAPGSVRARVVSVYQPHGQLDSNEHRSITRRTGWRMIQAHPWLGLGPEHVKRDFKKYLPEDVAQPLPEGSYEHLHNIYLQYAAERGIPTALALFWMLGKILIDFVRALRRLPPGVGQAKFILHGSVAVMVAILVGGLFEMNLGDSEVLLMFLATVACGYAAIREEKLA